MLSIPPALTVKKPACAALVTVIVWPSSIITSSSGPGTTADAAWGREAERLQLEAAFQLPDVLL
jgi:hypothetical protein